MAPRLFSYTPQTLVKDFPNLPAWAVDAFHEIKYSGKYDCTQHASQRLSANARALINIALMPMKGYIYNLSREDFNKILDADVDPKMLFETEEDYEEIKEHVDLCRLSKVIGEKWRFVDEREGGDSTNADGDDEAEF